MDSSFVNYDGRSVHDMIEALLAMSGDPEAIRRLQENINIILTKREQDIIKKRYGLYEEREMTQREIAKEMGISRSYVSRMEKKALEKLKITLSKMRKENED